MNPPSRAGSLGGMAYLRLLFGTETVVVRGRCVTRCVARLDGNGVSPAIAAAGAFDAEIHRECSGNLDVVRGVAVAKAVEHSESLSEGITLVCGCRSAS